jgi:Ca2+-binding EF-hand superfamily protein
MYVYVHIYVNLYIYLYEETLMLISVYIHYDIGELDFKEFLLSIMNFITVEKETRIKFSFVLFDDTKSGFITKKEVEEILRGIYIYVYIYTCI